MNKNKGFTLIELLVVVAIISLLASVILASLNNARAKGNDSKVKTQLLSLRNAIEIYYNTNNDYGASTASCGGGMFTDPNIAPLVNGNNYPSGTILDCGVFGSTWSVAASLSGATSNVTGPAWCIDNTDYSSNIAKATKNPYVGTYGSAGLTAHFSQSIGSNNSCF